MPDRQQTKTATNSIKTLKNGPHTQKKNYNNNKIFNKKKKRGDQRQCEAGAQNKGLGRNLETEL